MGRGIFSTIQIERKTRICRMDEVTDDVFTFTIWKATAESGGQKAETGAGIKTSHEEKKKRHIVPHSQLGNK